MRYIFIFILSLFSMVSIAQNSDQQLAQHYYSKGEYEKALVYYKRLYEKQPNKFYFKHYLNCLESTGDDKSVEKMLRKAASRNRYDNEYAIMLAQFYEEHNEPDKADKIYNDLIDDLPPSSGNVIQLYNAFKAQGKSDLSYKTLVKGRKLLRNSYPLNFQFAEYYGSVGETKQMINEYLDMIDYHPSYLKSIQRILSSQIDFSKEDSEEYELLRTALISRTQKNPDDIYYAEMLTWLFTQRKNFPAALTQVKAIDKRSKSNGRMVYEFGGICIENNDYRTARKAFKYVVELGDDKRYFMYAQNALLNVNFVEVTTKRDFTNDELTEICLDYQNVLDRYGMNESTFPLIIELAHIQAFYANKAEDAILILNKALVLSSLTNFERAQIKMELADVHVLHGDIWEASLLYMQIDSDFKFESIGQEAKFKNARIFYYDGEFEFAQSQLDVLKQSTSKLIANDAIQLSLLITDNLGLDSNYTAMFWFATADLLIEQHQYDKAYLYFDSIIEQFPESGLGDEILFKKGHSLELRGQWNEAILSYEELLKYYDTDILADDALFRIGDIYQNNLFDEQKASPYYKRILFEYKGSLHSVEARKRYRAIRSKGNSEGEL